MCRLRPCFTPVAIQDRKKQLWLGYSWGSSSTKTGGSSEGGVLSIWVLGTCKLGRPEVSLEQLVPAACVPLQPMELRLLRCELATCSSRPNLCPWILEKRQLRDELMRPNCTPPPPLLPTSHGGPLPTSLTPLGAPLGKAVRLSLCFHTKAGII